MTNHLRSAFISFTVAFSLILTAQIFKDHFSTSRSGTLAAGCLGGAEFIFFLTGISNLEMSNGGSQTRAGWLEILTALFLSVLSSVFIHRIAATICIFTSGTLLYFLAGISQSKYSTQQHCAQSNTFPKKRKIGISDRK